MTETRQCPDCGRALPPHAAPGQCPACLFQIGLAAADGGLGAATQLPSASATARHTIKVEPADAPGEAVGQTLGRYRLLEKLGEGGGGVVYVAEQTHPVRRRVALKVIKLGMDTKAVIARFEVERQALAMMDHPNIAKVFDAGTTETGRPYFVMELVRGIRITDYCDQNNLPTRQRLDLFIKVCQAIQHAHQKGIIHRDIKPSNLLVTLHDGVPVPKVIDFGIAKATEGRLTEATVYTQLHQFIGTPAYISPEQAEMSGLDIDTRSDIYSLGVLLYELLTGKTPFDAQALMASGMDAMRRTIRDQEPVRPSTKLATLQGKELTTTAKRRASDAPKLIHLLQGDLDWIVMKCLEKDRTRRYETANGLADDINRHLSNEPVIARPPSTIYRFQKAFRRNKGAFTATAAVAVALVAGIGISTWQALVAREAQRQTDAARLNEQQQRLEAQAAQKLAESERERAERNELVIRENAYASDMNLVQQALARSDLARARESLLAHEPKGSRPDLRGWEWWHYAEQFEEDEVFRLEGNPKVNALVSCPLHNGIITASENGSLELWNLTQRKVVARLLQSGEPIVTLTADPEGRYLAGKTANGPATIWDVSNLADLRVVGTLPASGIFRGVGNTLAPRLGLISMAPTPRDPWAMMLRTGGETVMTEVWNWKTGERVKVLPGMSGTFTTDGRLLATAPWNEPIRIWAVDGWKELHRLQPTGHRIGMCFSPDGNWLVTSNWEGDLMLWDVTRGALAGYFRGNSSALAWLVFSPDGQKLASAHVEGTISVWELATRRELFRLKTPGNGFGHVTFSPDGQWLTALGPDNRVGIWNASPAAHSKVPAPIYSIPVIAPDNRTVAYGNAQGQIELWDMETRTVKKTLPGEPNPLGFIENGNVLVTASVPTPLTLTANTMAGLKFWDLHSQTLLKFVPLSPANKVVSAASLSPSGTTLATGEPEGNVTLWDTITGKPLDQLTSGSNQVDHLVFSPNGSVLAIGLADEVKLWNRTTGKLTSIAGAGGTALAFSPDGMVVATGHFSTVRLWRTATGEELETLQGHRNQIMWLAFAKDGRTLASAGGEIKLWNLATRREVATFLPNSSPVFVGFSPNGLHLLGGKVGEVHVWTAASESNLPRGFHDPGAMMKPRTPQRDALTPRNLIDLSAHYNASLDDTWHPNVYENNNLAELPKGRQTFGGISYDVRGLIQLGHVTRSGQEYPRQIKGIRMGWPCQRLHFLHGAIRAFEKQGKQIGSYVVHLSNGEAIEIPLVLGHDLGDWWNQPDDQNATFTVAWSGQNEASRGRNRNIRLFKTTWENPLPQVAIGCETKFFSRADPLTNLSVEFAKTRPTA